jgi:membrane protease YdiL (CAAX protease family)
MLAPVTSPPAAPPRRLLAHEIVLVLAVSLGQSAVYAVVDLLGKLTAGKALASQNATLNASQAPGRPWLDLTYQLLGILFSVVPALLAVHLLTRNPPPGTAADSYRPVRAALGLDLRRPLRDLGWGGLLALAMGIPGLGIYLAARALGLAANVVPSALPQVWWVIPVLILSAVQNAVLEEVVVVGYLVTRLRQLSWPIPAVIILSAALRGSYHLYQGYGGFFGNLAMGVVFALFYLLTRRITPLIVAHSLLDIAAFVGYDLLHPYLHWL